MYQNLAIYDMEELERVGELEQRQVLLTGWTAYDEVLVKVKWVLGYSSPKNASQSKPSILK